MIKKFGYIVVSCLFIYGCNNNKIERPERPENLIAKDEMVNILYDMTILTAAKGTQIRIMEKNGVVPEQLIYKKYEIDSMQFVLSNEYYSYDIDAYEEIFRIVKEKLLTEKALEDSIVKQENEDRRRDIEERRSADSTATNSSRSNNDDLPQ